ncbi:MAG: hypothetical protein DRG39_04805 [Deltaproteobacteria bacterium]|nr:MAG: hypothetical protein DRG39_04805 [Deltaproteobacteria bacterium]
MNCVECKKRDKKIKILQHQLSIFKQKCRELQNKLNELIAHPTMLAGIRGEELIANIAKAARAKQGAPYDIKLKNGEKVEVKFSKITYPNRTNSKRWVWNGITGERGDKGYDYLVLIGEKDNEYYKYEDDNSNYIFFLLRKKDIKQVIAPRGKRGYIFLNILPQTTRSPYGKKLWEFKVSKEEIYNFFENIKVTSQKVRANSKNGEK